MASRLPVVVAQNALRAGRESELEETLVAELIFSNGLDATLIHGLSQVAEGSTDHLCLSGLMGDFALLSWEDANSVAEHLNRLGMSGQLAYTDPATLERRRLPLTQPGPKKIFLLLLHREVTTSSIMSELQVLLEAQNVQVISLGGPIPSKRKPIERSEDKNPSRDGTESVREKPVAATSPKAEASETFSSVKPTVSQPSVSSSTSANHPIPIASSASDEEDEWSHLDQLVDDLDASF